MRPAGPAFWSGRRVLVTGHTGFKGGWLACWLQRLGAAVYGFSLPPDAKPNLYERLRLPYAGERLADLRDPGPIAAFVDAVRPELVVHLAAQSLVRRGYREPVETFATNVMGTVNLLQALRFAEGLKAVLVVTSDKAYDNRTYDRPAPHRPFREDDPLGGRDPYSASKGAQEMVTHSFAESFFADRGIPVATARAGNVIGGGDWAADRIMTDVLSALEAGATIRLRHPEATRPWQHVLDPLAGYLAYVQALVEGRVGDRTLNFGPQRSHRVLDLVETALALWPGAAGWEPAKEPALPEPSSLDLDAARARAVLGWRPLLGLDEAVGLVVAWHRAPAADARAVTLAQIARYEGRLAEP
jgi:CDP-glucose 4,6-dehydratase